ncbi:BatA domain-containing protein [Rubripirellula amarantea]|nr:BatA domain-containing protein [Rubripirellula amarantea]
MTLLNGLLALGALAFTVPLVIHLFFRSKFRVVPWGAMHLIDSVMRVNRRRIQLMNLLLLLLRCAIPILLAFCLARPVLTGFQSLPGDAPQTVVVAIDDSRSMAIASSDSTTSMQRAIAATDQLLDTLSRRDEVMIVQASRLDEVPGAMGSAAAKSKIAGMGTFAGPVDLGRMMRAATSAADHASHPQRRIVVVSDFQTHMVDDRSVQTVQQLGETLAAKTIAPVISFLNVADLSGGADSGASGLGNLSVEQVLSNSAAVVAGRDAYYSARIRNHGDAPRGDVRLVWSIDGKPLRPQSITVPPRSSATTRLTQAIEDAGVHRITVAIEHADALAADNERSIGVEVIDEIRVLIVDGEPSNRPLEGEADFVSVALSPFAFGGQDQPDAVSTRVVNEREATKAIEKETYDVLIFAGVKKPSQTLKRNVADFIASGGSLVVFDHDKLDAKTYAEPWTTSDGQQPSLVLPTVMGNFRTIGKEAKTESFPMGRRNASYSAWDLLGDDQSDLFRDVTVTGYRQLTLRSSDQTRPSDQSRNSRAQPSSTQSPSTQSPSTQFDQTEPQPVQAKVLLSLANGDPLIVMSSGSAESLSERSSETATASRAGRVVQFAVPADATYSTFPLRAVYLPMLQQMILDLAGSRNPVTFDVGEPIAVDPSRAFKNLPDINASLSSLDFRVVLPDGTEQKPKWLNASAASSASLLLPATYQPGVYRLTANTDSSGQATDDTSESVLSTIRVVEVPAIESDARSVDEARLASVAELIGASVYSGGQDLVQDDQTRRFGREIWRWLLFALLALMVIELWLQQSLGTPQRAKQPAGTSSNSNDTQVMGASS